MDETKTAKPLFVIDASVLLKWLLNEPPNFQQCSDLLIDFSEGKTDILRTPHCYFEVLNILGIKVTNDAMFLFSRLLTLNIPEQRLSLEIAFRAVSIMQRCSKVSFYDASYHATAIENNGTFITADEGYYRKAKSFKHIKLLKDYQ